MVGNRLKLIRQANGLSLQDLSNLLDGSDLQIGRAALSHYETGSTLPSEKALQILAKKLGTTVEFFHEQDWEDVKFTIFTPNTTTTQKSETTMLSFVQIELEKMLFVDKLLEINDSIPFPEKIHVSKKYGDEIEGFSDDFRNKAGLGRMPIASVINTLEDLGWKTMEMQASSPFVSGFEHSSMTAFILYPSLFAIDDFRLALLETIGYAYIEGEDAIHTSSLVSRFARAMLFPKDRVIAEFGCFRESISLSELALAKQKYGISKRSIMFRLCELGIIKTEYFDSFEDLMRLHGFPKRKQILSENLMFYENPTMFPRRVLEAQSRHLLSDRKVESLLLLRNLT